MDAIMDKRLPSLSMVFPAYNEEANVAETIRQALDVGARVSDVFEVIIINDGSRDRTGDIAESWAKNDSRVRVIHHAPNQGYGGAVWSGLQAARYDYVFWSDADLQFDLRELSTLIAFVPDSDVVLGYRAKRQDPFLRLLNAKGWNMLNRFLFGLKLKDVDCAFKLFKAEVIKNVPVISRGAMLSVELLVRLMRRGVRFQEVPVTHLPRVAGSPTGAKLSVIFRALREMLCVFGELRREKLH